MNEPHTLFELFAGQRGFSLAFECEGFRTVGVSEIEEWANVVGKFWYPAVENFGDLTAPDFSRRVLDSCGTIDVLTGGVPCQPASTLGKRLGTADARWLWGDAIRICGELRPRFAVFENPPALLTLERGKAFNGIVSGLAEIGYDCMWEPIPAAIFGAGHLRWRVCIVAANARYSATSKECQCERDEVGRKQFGGEFCVSDAADSQGGQTHDGGRRELANQARRGKGVHEAAGIGCDAPNGNSIGWRQGARRQDGAEAGHGGARLSAGNSHDQGPQGHARHDRTTNGWQKPRGHLAPSDLRGRINCADWWHEANTGIPVLASGLSAGLVEAATRCVGNSIVPQAWRPIARALNQILNDEK